MFLTSKKLMYDTMSPRRDGSHDHCPLEGSALELDVAHALGGYQPAFALSLPRHQPPSPWEFVGAVNEERLVSGWISGEAHDVRYRGCIATWAIP